MPNRSARVLPILLSVLAGVVLLLLVPACGKQPGVERAARATKERNRDRTAEEVRAHPFFKRPPSADALNRAADAVIRPDFDGSVYVSDQGEVWIDPDATPGAAKLVYTGKGAAGESRGYAFLTFIRALDTAD